MSKKINNHIPILSFYSGGGFLDMGFEKAGFQIVWTNEIDQAFAKLHAAGITSWRKSCGNGLKAEIFNTESITDIRARDIIKEAFPQGKPGQFGIIGGPPCQDFSTNGSSVGFHGERGKLTIQFLDKIYELKPTFFVMENVTGLLKHKSHKEYLFKMLQRTKQHYHVDHKVLNALDFGVPQFRERVFFVGFSKTFINRKDLSITSDGHWFSWPANKTYEDALTKFKWPQASKYRSKVSKGKNIPLKLCVKNCLVPDSQQKTIPNADEYFILHGNESTLNKIQEGETNRPSFKRLHRFKFSPTACYGNNEVHLHPYKQRRISVREALRIQGVPDEYILPKDIFLTKKFKMIGNGVPVPLAEAVASSVLKFIKQKMVKE